ncbi:MAG: SpvB/TcaC N-terminal domain-containing protein [Flavisolibacter sp.]
MDDNLSKNTSPKSFGDDKGSMQDLKKEIFNRQNASKSNAIEIPSIHLPKGGGAIKNIDEKFLVNAVNGTSSLSIPLPITQARGVTPSLALNYNSGSGNGIFGLGWNLTLSSIKRKTDKLLPQYNDQADSDIFLFSEAEDLVPVFKKEQDGSFSTDAHGDYIIEENDSADGSSVVRRYQPRVEGLFARIERWTEKNTGVIKWRITTRDNTTTLYGWTEASRLADPVEPGRQYEWFPEFGFDDKGNCCQYIYKPEDDKGFDKWALHNRNRFKAGKITYTNLYLSTVHYGNRAAYKKFLDPLPPVGDYLFSLQFDYGQYSVNSPYTAIRDWDYRTDAFSDYKSGFEVRVTRLCKRVLLFHHFTGSNEYDGLVKSIDFGYDTSIEQDFTFLISVTSRGYNKKPDGSYTSQSLPPLEFGYQKHEWNRDISIVSIENLANAAGGIDERQYQFTDLFNEGLAGILTENTGGWYYKSNLGDGKFSPAKEIRSKPAFSGLGKSLHLGDIDGNGGKQFICYDNAPKGFFELDDDNQWLGFRAFESVPSVSITDRNNRMIDLNGDGRLDLLIPEDNAFTWYQSLGKRGFDAAVKTQGSFDEEAGPVINLGESLQTIFLADMSGGGLMDIVRIRNGEISYWPNLGYGKFGNKVSFDHSPTFDEPDAFNSTYIRLADIDGSGTTDIIYLGKNKFTCWKNLSGNRFDQTPFEIDSFPDIHPEATVSVTDFLGNGVACIVWSSTLAKDGSTPMKYIDLMRSKKPHLLNFFKNNFGKEIRLTYTASTRFYLDDKAAGTPWITKLHFPVHCISNVLIEDKITGHQFSSSYVYHHGYFDHPEKEFRGFGMVEQTDTENFENWSKGGASNIVNAELHQQPVVTRQWSHTGAFLRDEKILTQFETESWNEELTRQGFAVANHEKILPDAVIVPAPAIAQSVIDNLDGEEYQQALRACKGMALRTETFALDAPKINPTAAQIQTQLTPYSVATHNCLIELLQPKGKNKHAIFLVKESEAITYNYERDVADPRISHHLNIVIDEYGNILESALVTYPRINLDGTLPEQAQMAQAKLAIVYSQNKFTNDVADASTYRLRVNYEATSFELKGVKKTGFYYSPGDFTDILTDANTDTALYYERDKPLVGSRPQKRLVEDIRSFFYRDDFSGSLSLGRLDPGGIPFETYQLAYTPELLANIYGPINQPGSKVTNALMIEGKFVHCKNELDVIDTNWWVPSGTTQYIEGIETVTDVSNRFYVPISYTEPFGGKTILHYYSTYFFMIEETIDALLNSFSVLRFNFRNISPEKMKDPNDNITEILTNELGIIKALAVSGKGHEADDLSGWSSPGSAAEDLLISDFFGATDSTQLVNNGKSLLRHASFCYIHDFDRYRISGNKEPAAIVTIARVDHYQNNPDAAIQISFEYSDGFGGVAMKKTQAEPGEAKKITINPDDTYTVSIIDSSALDPKQLRWRGNGRQVLNNKGSVVKAYEPYFSFSWKFENQKELVESGVSPVLYYDPLGRLVKTKYPDGTVSRVAFNGWKQSSYDQNDELLNPECSWYVDRTNHLIDAELLVEGKDPVKEKNAADWTLSHADTPLVQHMDTLGRPILLVENNGKDALNNHVLFYTKIDVDIESNVLSIQDDRGNIVMTDQFDMLGHKVYQHGMDSGERWLLQNIVGNPLRTWDGRNHEFSFEYDILHRPTIKKVTGGDGYSPLEANPLNNVYEKIIYGESDPAAKAKNIRTRAVIIYDTAGKSETLQFDFKGNPGTTQRRFCTKYKDTVEWSGANPDLKVEPDVYSSSIEYNAFNLVTKRITSDGSVFLPHYNEASLLDGIRVIQNGNSDPYVTAISYNERSSRKSIQYGNGVSTRYEYDQKTFRLIRLQTRRSNNDPLQDLYYTFDAVGNIIFIEDKNIPDIFFNNQKITGVSEYTYDPLYRLSIAKGREHAGQLNFGVRDNWNDQPFLKSYQQLNSFAWRMYTEGYAYDHAGNIKRMKHTAADGSWIRDYTYENDSNRLQSTTASDPAAVNNYNYAHHPQHGFISSLPHLQFMFWNFKDQFQAGAQQKVVNGIAETTFYVYDGSGQRVRKITERAFNGVGDPPKKSERMYVGGIEIYTEYDPADVAGLVRTTYHVMDDRRRIAMIETRNDVDDGSPKRLVRYQFGNHLGSAAIETEGSAAALVISYEEYHPFGTTSYQAVDKDIKAAYKRYRYTGMERDSETGLDYHGARYYLPWLGRWLSTDPVGINAGLNVYAYTHNNPVMSNDAEGMQPTPAAKQFQAPVIQESGGLPTTQVITHEGKTVKVEFIPGTSDKTVLIVGGVHQDETKAKELRAELVKSLHGEKPYYNIILIEDLFGDRKTKSRAIGGLQTNTGNFPNAKESLADSAKRGGGVPIAADQSFKGVPVKNPAKILPENVILITLLEKYKDKLSFTLSIHDHGNLDKDDPGNGAPGFYLDQKEGGDPQAVQLDKDVVQKAQEGGAVVEGNFLGKVNPSTKKYERGPLTSEYPNSTAKQPTPGQSFGTYGSSLGLNQYLVEVDRAGKGIPGLVTAIKEVLLADPSPPPRGWKRPMDYDCVQGRGSRMFPHPY